MKIIFYSYYGIDIIGKGLILFGITRKKLRSFFDESPKALMLGENDNVPTDSYYEASIRFFYNDFELLQAIAIEYEHDLIFENQHLLRNSYQQIQSWFKKIDRDLEINYNSGFASYSYGINLWAPGADENLNSTAESALIFARGYNP